jgi:hypothetical protein
MALPHTGLPKTQASVLSKTKAMEMLKALDSDVAAVARVLAMENDFRTRIRGHVGALPIPATVFSKLNTSPFVLLFHAMKRSYTRISEIEADILPAQMFSSMETSAGRMAEVVALPVYNWECVASGMQTFGSALDGKRLEGDVLKLATLKSGPRCLNDEMSENLADAIIQNTDAWAAQAGVRKIDFTYGVLYGTQKTSNKKDWHILRNIHEKLSRYMTVEPTGRWDCAFNRGVVETTVSVRIGAAWWQYLGGPNCLVELCAALVRACILPGEGDPASQTYTITDLGHIVSLASVPEDFNVSILQRSQYSWLFFIIRHFCDALVDG